MSNDKTYSAEEVARKVLEKAQEMLSKSDLYKSNNSHDVEAGEEPKNDDAEAPDYLAEADIEDDGKDDNKRRKSVASEGSGSASSSDDSEPAHEKDMSEEENEEHDAAENDDDERDADNIEADEETYEEEMEADDSDLSEDVAGQKGSETIIKDAASENDKKKKDSKDEEFDPKKAFKKSELGVNKLKNFLAKMEHPLKKDVIDFNNKQKLDSGAVKRRATVQRNTPSSYTKVKSKEELQDQDKSQGLGGEQHAKVVASDVRSDARKKSKSKKIAKNKKMEKFLGVDSKQAKMKPEGQQKPQEPQEPQGSGMKGY